MSVYTKTGDEGRTSLYTGERVDKDSLRVETYGTVDEMNSALGMARAACKKDSVRKKILHLQGLLPILMTDLASIGKEPRITLEHVAGLEGEMDEMEALLPPLRAFLVPGGTQGGAALDMARTIARRAERGFLRLGKVEQVHETDRVFLNRLSDYCFLLMRLEEQEELPIV